MCSYSGARLRRSPSTQWVGQIIKVSASSQVGHASFSREAPFPFLSSLPTSTLLCFWFFYLLGPTKPDGQMDSFRYYVVDFKKENQFNLCLWNQPTLRTNTQTSVRATYHSPKFHHAVCLLWNEKGRIQKSGAYFTRNFRSVAFFYKHNLQLYLFCSWKNVTSTQIWLNFFPLLLNDLSNAFIHII